MRMVLFSALLLLAFPAAGQNLLDDGSFESGNVSSCSLGLVPDTWIRILGTPDTFSSDCGLSPGAPLSFAPGHFLSLGSAADGLRFLAATNGPAQPDGFGQLLAAPLEVGTSYRISAQVARSSVTSGDTAIDVYLAVTPTFDGAVWVASLPQGASIGSWTTLSSDLCPPEDAASRPYLLIRPRVGVNSVYLATDAWLLEPGTDPCPQVIPGPGPLSLTALALLLLALGLTARRRVRARSR